MPRAPPPMIISRTISSSSHLCKCSWLVYVLCLYCAVCMYVCVCVCVRVCVCVPRMCMCVNARGRFVQCSRTCVCMTLYGFLCHDPVLYTGTYIFIQSNDICIALDKMYVRMYHVQQLDHAWVPSLALGTGGSSISSLLTYSLPRRSCCSCYCCSLAWQYHWSDTSDNVQQLLSVMAYHWYHMYDQQCS